MKNKYIFSLIIIFTVLFMTRVFAASDINIYIDGQNKKFEYPPLIQNGRTLVPMREFFETLDCKIYWNGETRSVYGFRDDVRIKITIDNNKAYVNDKELTLDVPAKLINSKTYIPLRFISESLGAKVIWEGTTRTITILDKIKEQLKPYELVDTEKYELKTTFSFINNGDKIDAKIDVLLGSNSNSPYQIDEDVVSNIKEEELYVDDYGNSYSKIKIDDIQKGQALDIIVTKKLLNGGIKYNINESTIKNNFESLEKLDMYTNPQLYIESDDEYIIEKAKELAGSETNPYLIAKKVFQFVNSYIIYDESDKYARKGALSTLITGRGVCEDYSKLFVALLRANNIPARSVFGYWLNDEVKQNITKNSWYNIESVAHEWPEFYIEGYGWIIAEPTFLYNYNGIQTVPWNQFANQEKNGHVIYGYESNSENALKWSISGYGKLDLQFLGITNEIRKMN